MNVRLTSQSTKLISVFLTVILFLTLLAYVLRVAPSQFERFASGDEHELPQHKADVVHDVNNSTLGFEKVLIISLPERRDHRDQLLLATKISNITAALIDGVHGEDVPKKILPANYNKQLQASGIGAWRAHLDALSEIIRQDVSTALILEDDVDWDIRLKTILHEVAISAQTFSNKDHAPSLPFSSPYGDHWDVLWLGHCGMHLPIQEDVVLQENDVTVPESRYLRSFIENEVTPLARYPQHVRAVFKGVPEGTCSLGYAVTQSAARRLLFELGLDHLTESFDLMLRGWCEQSDRLCIGVLPQIFDHYRRTGPGDVDSDISAPRPDFRTKALTNNIRWSVQLNMRELLDGGENYTDQYPDT